MDPLLASPDSTVQKVYREGELLAGAAGNICGGIKSADMDAWSNPQRTTKLLSDAVIGGAVISMVAKNPAILGKGLQPACELAIARGGAVVAALVATDLSQRIAEPLAQTWNFADELNSKKQKLGDRLGEAVIDYTLLSAGGVAGARLSGSLNHCRNLISNSFVTRPAYSFSGVANVPMELSNFNKPSSLATRIEAPTINDLVHYNQEGKWWDRTLTGKTHVAEPGQRMIQGNKGDIVLHAPQSGKNYIAAKVLDEWAPTEISTLKDFDIRDILAKEHVNFKSASHRLLNLQVIKDAVSKLWREEAVRREVRHHTIDEYNHRAQYRLRSPMWLDPTISAPRIELPLTGRITRYEPAKPRTGDLVLCHELDSVGSHNKNVMGNGAHSGMFALKIYDNELWLQKFNLRKFLFDHTEIKNPDRLYYFHTQWEMKRDFPKMLELLRPLVKENELAVWNHSSKKGMFEIRKQ